ncbi:TPA_asm: portal protein [Caudoviricetes sp. vir519]|nr:TPA_asm: portal protein [Caudoviricetes sp. vir519]
MSLSLPRLFRNENKKTEPQNQNGTTYRDLSHLHEMRALQDHYNKMKSAAQFITTGVEHPDVEGIKRPFFNYSALITLARESWPLQMIFNVFWREIEQMGYHIEPAFAFKCRQCGTEYPKDQTICDVCGGVVHEPDPIEKLILKRLIENPCPTQEIDNIMHSIVEYLLTVDDFFIEVGYSVLLDPLTGEFERTAVQWGLMDSRITFPVTDVKGNLGGGKYCPYCTRKSALQDTPLPTVRRDNEERCNVCGCKLEPISWIQEKNGKVVAQFSGEEVIHGARYLLLPDLLGDPPMHSLLEALQIIECTDMENLEKAETGEEMQFLVFPGANEQAITELYNQILKKFTTTLGKAFDIIKNKYRTVILGGPRDTKPEVINLSRSSRESELLEWWKNYTSAIIRTYSVQLKFTGEETPGRLGHFDEDLSIQQSGIESITKVIENVLNRMFRQCFKITDWEFQFGEFRKEDQLQKVQIDKAQGEVIKLYKELGISARYEEGKLILEEQITPVQQASKSILDRTEMEHLKTFPQQFKKIFWEILVQSIKENWSFYQTYNEMEDAVVKFRSRKLNLTEIEDIKRIIRNEWAKIRNSMKFQQFIERELKTGRKKKYSWAGPYDEKTTEMCHYIHKRVEQQGDGKGVPLDELIGIIDDAMQKFREYATGDYNLPHIQCRHTPQVVITV